MYSHYFYLALYPLIVLMAVAVGRRVMDYGMTEPRYFILVFTVWLLIVATRFTLRPRADIRFIPLTLFVLTAAATWGPWSAMSVSKWNQTARLKSILEKQGLLVNGKLQKTQKDIDSAANFQISNIVSYLEDNFGLGHLEKGAPSTESVIWSQLSASEFLNQAVGLQYQGSYSRAYHSEDTRFSFYSSKEDVIEISGYDYFGNFSLFSSPRGATIQSLSKTFKTPQGGDELTISFDPLTGKVKAFDRHDEVTLVTFSEAWFKENRKNDSNELPWELMTFTASQGNFHCRLKISNLHASQNIKDAHPILTELNGLLLFSFGPE